MNRDEREPAEPLYQSDPIIVKQTDKSTTSIVVSLLPAESDLKIDIREYVDTGKYEGPTRRGISFSIEAMTSVQSAMVEIERLIANR